MRDLRRCPMMNFACVRYGALVLAAATILGMHVSAAEPPNAGNPPAAAPRSAVDPTFIPSSAVAAWVAHPHDLLTGPAAEQLPVEVLSATGLTEMGIDPVNIDEAIVLFTIPPDPPAEATSAGEPIGFIVRFVAPVTPANIVAKLGSQRHAKAELAGRPIWKSPYPRLPSFCFPDSRTMVSAPEAMLRQMLAAENVDSPLVKLLKVVDCSSQLTLVASVDAMRDTLHRELKNAPPLPPNLQGFLKLPDLLSAVLIRVNLGKTLQAELTLHAVDAASAEDVEKLLHQGLEIGKRMAMAEIAQLPGEPGDPVGTAWKGYLNRVTSLAFGLVKPIREGPYVKLSCDVPVGPGSAGILTALLLPAVQSARSAAQRNANTSKIRQVGLALLDYETAHRKFPARAIFDKNGKPLLSWRVAVLPFLDEAPLYKQFHMDEPWDSEHNKALIAQMPPVFESPDVADPTKTPFLAPVGKGLAFEGDHGLRAAEFTDGTSKTILLVEADAEHAVPWTKPDDLEIDMSKPLAGLNLSGPHGCMVMFADTHVENVTDQIDLATFKALLTRAGGEPIDVTKIR